MKAYPPAELEHHVCFLSGSWIPKSAMAIPVDDLGFRQGVIAVERMRTYDDRVPFATAEHLARFENSAVAIGISGLPDQNRLHELVDELIARNQDQVDALESIGVTLFATPGRWGTSAPEPTLGIHLNLLDRTTNQRRRLHGQPIFVSNIQSPPSASWPRTAKVRSRIHYFLADQQARQRDPEAVAVLVDQDQTITESSIANLAIVESGRIVSPLAKQVLPGITENHCRRLAKSQDLPWTNESISGQRLAAADEVLMMGTDTGVWFASHVDGQRIGTAPGPVCRILQQAFRRFVK